MFEIEGFMIVGVRDGPDEAIPRRRTKWSLDRLVSAGTNVIHEARPLFGMT